MARRPPSVQPTPSALLHGVTHWHTDPAQVSMSKSHLEDAVTALEEGQKAGLHAGAQLYVSRQGQAVLEYAGGDGLRGSAVVPDSCMAWFSCGKPLTAMGVALLLDQGKLGLEDKVSRYLPGFGQGKEHCTLRHLLTHTGGFPQAFQDEGVLSWEDTIETIVQSPAETPPGQRAAYDAHGAWFILGEVLRVVTGQTVDQFLREALLRPLGMTHTHLGISPEVQGQLKGLVTGVALGRSDNPPPLSGNRLALYNSPAALARVNPGAGFRGPARDLGRFYEMLLNGGQVNDQQLLDLRTVALFTACHRWGMPDKTLHNAPLAWGLGFALHGLADFPREASRRVFGHSGMVSAVAFADPESGVVAVILTNGLLDALSNAHRLRKVGSAIMQSCQT